MTGGGGGDEAVSDGVRVSAVVTVAVAVRALYAAAICLIVSTSSDAIGAAPLSPLPPAAAVVVTAGAIDTLTVARVDIRVEDDSDMTEPDASDSAAPLSVAATDTDTVVVVVVVAVAAVAVALDFWSVKVTSAVFVPVPAVVAGDAVWVVGAGAGTGAERLEAPVIRAGGLDVDVAVDTLCPGAFGLVNAFGGSGLESTNK